MRANKRPRSSDHAARRRALADATAGVIGSLASVLAFYPVDVWKTSLQAGVDTDGAKNAKEECEESDAPNPKLGDEGSASLQMVRPKPSRLPSSSVPPLSRLFRGLPHKIIHTIVSSFTYFFVYSLVQTKYAAYRQQSVRPGTTTSTVTKLLLTAFAAVINTGITLPLDTISSRKQAGTTSTTSSSGKGKDKQVKPILKVGKLGVKKEGGGKGESSKGKANENGLTSCYMPSYEDIANNGDTTPSLESSDDNYSASETNNDGYISARGSFSEEYHSANEEYEDALEGEQNIECTPQNKKQDVKEEDASNNDDSVVLKQSCHANNATSNNTTKNRRQLYIKSPEKYKFSFSTNLAQEAFATTSRGSSSSFGNLVDSRNNNNNSSDNNLDESMSKQKRRHVELKSLWNGLFPALLLCTNPAIQYTMYDTLKNALLQHRMILLASMKRKGETAAGGGSEGESTSQSSMSNNKLTMWEAFVFGLISKFFATIITYPLIRCKVLLMVSSPEAFLDGGGGASGEEDGDYALRRQNVYDGQSNDAAVNNGHGKKSSNISSENAPPPSTSASRSNNKNNNQKRYPRSLLLLLIHIFKNDGVRGIYKGCSLQLLHTILKSALLMMVREKITFVTHRFFQVDN